MDDFIHYEAADKLLNILSEKTAIQKDSLRNSIIGSGNFIDFIQYNKNLSYLIDKNIIEFTGRGDYLKLNALGFSILKNGGLQEYVREEERKEARKKKKDEEEDELRGLNLFNAKRQKFTFYISIIALFISATLAFLKIAETFKFGPYG